MLRKKSKPVREVTDHIRETLEDMVETMRQANGVGLAAPQVGVMRRMFVAEPVPDEVYYMVNPRSLSRTAHRRARKGASACLTLKAWSRGRSTSRSKPSASTGKNRNLILRISTRA